MVDYSINENFDIHRNEWGDFVTVDGLAEFEQDVVVQLHANQRDLIYQNKSDTTKQKIKLQVQRIARQFDVIDSISRISVEKTLGEEASYEVEVWYNTGDTFKEEL